MFQQGNFFVHWRNVSFEMKKMPKHKQLKPLLVALVVLVSTMVAAASSCSWNCMISGCSCGIFSGSLVGS